jgi:2-polyprenyl-3-methyl-5-hydroxy-6-metoxy-1,4-benzoquinol methylase
MPPDSGALSVAQTTGTTAGQVFRNVRRMYRRGNPLQRWMAYGRPFISPFHVLVDHVPAGASLLDVGCGNGLWVNLLVSSAKISRGVGFDSSLPAIEAAREAPREYGARGRAEFTHLAADGQWPPEAFDVVSLIDVLHHIRPSEQRRVVDQALAKVSPGGLFLFKDIGSRPFWRALANRIHDLILARQWVHYVEPAEVIAWAREGGFVLEHRQTINMLWYGHELLVFRRPMKAAAAP